MSARISASLQAIISVKSSMLGSHMRIFCAMVSSKSTTFWSITATEFVSSSLGMLSMGLPSKRISPLHGL